jgi:hypothetical protein
MPEPELSLLFIRPLNRIAVRYLVSGSVAAILYGDQGNRFVPFLERVFSVPPLAAC